MKKLVMMSGLALLLVGGLQACCSRSGNASGNGYAAAASSPGQAGTLEITVWGPRQTTAGDPFNVQQGGQAAIWIRVDQPLDGWIAQIEFDDAVLEGHGSGHLVTAVVPEALYANRGTYEVRVAARKANALRLSNTVLFTVR
ncbi:MAG TPA: hypothetical protein VIR05_03110 [Luteimonas sp.]